MRRRVQIFAVMVAGTFALGCSEESPTLPSTTPQFVLAPGDALVCSFPDANKANRAYFAKKSSSLNDVKGKLGAMKSAGAGSATATSTGFDIFGIIATQVAALHDGGASDVVGTPADGSDLVNQVLACMDQTVTNVSVAIDFSGPLGPAGAFCMRGGAGDDPAPCLASDDFSGIAPPATGFPAWFGRQALLYGQPLAVFLSNEIVVGGQVEYSTIPAGLAFDNSNGKGLIGMCVPNLTDERRVQHREQGNTPTILLFNEPTFLPCFALANGGEVGPPLLRFARGLFDWVAPTPLYATSAVIGGGTGGSLGDLSKFAVVNAGAINLSFTPPIQDQKLSMPFDVTVRALGNQGTPFIDLTVRISIQGNSTSQTSVLTGAQCTTTQAFPQGSCLATTDRSGNALFHDIQINKSGGYRLLGESSALPAPGSPDASSVVSNLFNVNP